jgi:hypothetical protein
MTTDPTVTPAQLREDAAWYRNGVARRGCDGCDDCDICARHLRAAAALDAQADAMEARASDRHGWGVMRADGTLEDFFQQSQASALDVAEWWSRGAWHGDRVVPVRLTTEGARAQEVRDD